MAGQLLLAFAFLATGIRNAGWPHARVVLTAGLALQFVGGTLLALDLWRPLAAALLVAFTVAASAIFHRWWLIADPLLSHLHFSNLLVNCGVVGGLLLVVAI
jgi:putative oxidoreductase